MTPPVRIGLVGCGAVSQLYYAPALEQLERRGTLRVLGLFDPVKENMARINKRFREAVPVRDLDEFTGPGLDLAIVASPPEYHASQTIHLLQSGLSVLCEKPMALSVQEGEAMLKTAQETGRILAIGLFRRFLPATQAIREILATEALGEVLSFSCFEGGIFRWPVHSPAYFARNGVLMDIGVHLLDLLYWWWGQPVELAYQDDAMGGVEVNCRIQIRFKPGFSGEVRLSRDWGLPNRYLIRCTKGWLSWDVHEADSIQVKFDDSSFILNSQILQTHRLPGKNEYKTSFFTTGDPAGDFQRSFTRQIENVLAAVRGEAEPVVSGETGLDSLRLVEACYHNRTLMDIPWFNPQEQEKAHILSGRRL